MIKTTESMTDLEEKIWGIVHRWCDQQREDIPDQNRRYLMDQVKALCLGKSMDNLSRLLTKKRDIDIS